MSASIPLIDIGNRRELLVDDFLVDRMDGGAALRLHHPVPREAVLVTDRPWEGNNCGYITVFEDGGLFRMYYLALQVHLEKGSAADAHKLFIAYAESRDAVHWERPDLGLFEFDGSRRNNIVFEGIGDNQKGCHGFSAFKDTNPACPPGARYKAVGGERMSTRGPLWGMVSADGVHWSLAQDEPIIVRGKFDSQNIAFWDSARGEYRVYVRDMRDGRRDVRTAVSPDFLHWTEPEWIECPGAPPEELYTNQVIPYYRAPHFLLGFPTRYVERPWSESIEALPELDQRRMRSAVRKRYGTALTDGLFMSSRDGRVFRRWGEAFIRPGLRTEGNWVYGDNYQNWGIVETPSLLPGAPNELSFFVPEGCWRQGRTVIRRHTLRMDGFVSVNAPLSGGGFMTRPMTFDGARMEINFSTSAAGGVRVGIFNADGSPVEGFTPDECVEAIGDTLAYEVRWKGRPSLAALAGRPVRVLFAMRDADLYSFRTI